MDEITDTQRLEWLVTGKGREKAARVMGSDARGWAVCDCSNGLTFFGQRDHVTFRDALDEAIRSTVSASAPTSEKP